MAANLVEKLQEAIKACEEIPVKDLKAQKQQIAEQFKELQKAVFEIVDEKTIILSNLKWEKTEKKAGLAVELEELLKGEAKRIALQYGYSSETVFEMLQTKNEFNYHIDLWFTYIKYTYWTLVE